MTPQLKLSKGRDWPTAPIGARLVILILIILVVKGLLDAYHS